VNHVRDERPRRHLTALIAAAVAFGVVPAGVALPSPPAAAAPISNIGNQQPSLPWESHSKMIADLDAVAAAGMTWVRTDFYWPKMEPQRGRFAWGPTDEFVRAATARGLRVLPVPDYTPAWAASGPSDHYPPRNLSDYAAFVAAAARRYAPMGVHTWEIWNEQNRASFWLPKADPPTYTHLLQQAYAAIKRVDPRATVISGGLSPAGDNGHDMAPQTFLDQIYRNGARGSFDAVGYHPYSWPYPPMYAASWNTFYQTPNVHALMAHYGDGGKQIWGTETGWPTGTGRYAVSESTQAKYTVDAIRQWESWSFHGPFFLYTIHDLGTNKNAWDQNMGMLDYRERAKPVFGAVKALLAGAGLPSVQPGVGRRGAPRSGTATLRVPVTLDQPSRSTVTVRYMTLSAPPKVNARPGVDYDARSGTLTFAPGQTRAAVAITIRAAHGHVANDVFLVRFHDPTHAVLGGLYGLGIGVITPGPAADVVPPTTPGGGPAVPIESALDPTGGPGAGGSVGTAVERAAALRAANCGVAHRAVPDHRIARPHPRPGIPCAVDLSSRTTTA
jgi:hypothetical protein